LGFAQHVLARHGDGEGHPVALRFARADHSAHVHLDLTRVARGHGAGEPHAVGGQFPRIAETVGRRRNGAAHREHPAGADAPEAPRGSARAATARPILSIPWAMTRPRPTSVANRSSQWIGWKSPGAPAYRTSRARSMWRTVPKSSSPTARALICPPPARQWWIRRCRRRRRPRR